MFTRERHRPGVWYFGPYANAKKVRETLDVLNRVFPYRPCEGPKPGRHSRHPVPRLPHRSLPRALRRLRLAGGLPRDHRRRDRVPLRRREADPARARAADAARRRRRSGSRTRRATATGCSRCSTSSSGRRSSAQSVGTADVIGFAADGDRAVVQIFPLRGGKMVDRYSFHLENVGGQDVTTVLESFGLEYYGSAPSVPPQIVVPRDAGDLVGARGAPLRAARLARRDPHRRARREAAAAASSPTRTRGTRSPTDRAQAEQRRAAPGRGARGAARGAQPRVAAAAHRVLRHLALRWARTPSARWSSSRTGCRRRRTTGSSAIRGQVRAWTTSPRWRR